MLITYCPQLRFKQEFEDSIEYVKKSIAINDDNPGYHVTLGCAYSAKKDYESSIKAFKVR